MSNQASIDDAFEAAKTGFLRSLKDPEIYDFSRFTSIDDVYDEADEIQQQQSRTGTLRNLSRIRPYLECLKQYVDVIDTFVQAKPDLLSLIWVGSSASASNDSANNLQGPIKLLLQVSTRTLDVIRYLLTIFYRSLVLY
jgi:hypothetical protein